MFVDKVRITVIGGRGGDGNPYFIYKHRKSSLSRIEWKMENGKLKIIVSLLGTVLIISVGNT